jgi:predicted amidohydrolase
LLKGGHVIDAKNNIDRVTDVAIANGKIARVADDIPAADAKKTLNVSALYVTPGLVDIHVHLYANTGRANSYAGDWGIYPDNFTFRSGVTTDCDAGTSGWRTPPYSRTLVTWMRTRQRARCATTLTSLLKSRRGTTPEGLVGAGRRHRRRQHGKCSDHG